MNRRKETVRITAEINELENKNTTGTMNEKLSWISGMTKKMHKSLVRLTKDNFLEEISLE